MTENTPDLEGRLAPLRSLQRWPSPVFTWERIGEFEKADSLGSGIHSFHLGSTILDVYIDIIPRTAAFVFLHGNCPRSPNFQLPVFSGSNVSSDIRTTRIVPSDPVLLLDPQIELSWHAGAKNLPLQEIYKAIFRKVFAVASAPYAVFWGGSGGGFASLYYSFFFPSSIAFVWNPQTIIWKYLPDAVLKYRQVSVGDVDTPSDEAAFREIGVEGDLPSLYANGHSNRIIYLQNYEDWHTQSHLMPLLDRLGLTGRLASATAHNGALKEDFYLFLGNFSKDHQPPATSEISLCLNHIYRTNGDLSTFDLAPFLRNRHRHAMPQEWLVDAILSSRIAVPRIDWPGPDESPKIDRENPASIRLSTGEMVELTDTEATWNREFVRNITTNYYELYSLAHAGRLVTLFERTTERQFADAAFSILDSFLGFIAKDESYTAVMTNRGRSSADHAMSIRANVLVKFIQVFHGEADRRETLGRAAMHLLDIADFLSDDKHIYPSNHGMMVCVTLLQIAAQLRGIVFLSSDLLRTSSRNILALTRASFDRDGFTNENTVGYHHFILRLLKEYAGYCKDNGLSPESLSELRERIRQGELALAICVRQDSTIPTIGDSPRYKLAVDSINCSKWFKESGLLILKDSTTYLSFICGSRSENHKQADEGSITIHHAGEDFIIDGGSFCYDSGNPLRRYVESFRGHSTVYADSFAGASAREYIKLLRKDARIECVDDSHAFTYARGMYEVGPERTRFVRHLWQFAEGEFLIEDDVQTVDPRKLGTIRQSFLMAPHLKLVHHERGCLAFEGERFGIAIVSGTHDECLVSKGVEGEQPAGWCSVDWQKILPAYQILFSSAPEKASFVTSLKIFTVGKAIETIRLMKAKRYDHAFLFPRSEDRPSAPAGDAGNREAEFIALHEVVSRLEASLAGLRHIPEVSAESERRRLSIEALEERLSQANEERSAILRDKFTAEQRAEKASSTISFMLGSAFINGTKSLGGFLSLPSALWAVHRESKRRRTLKKARSP